MQRRKLLLLGSIPGQKIADQLPCLDEELLLRAREALADKDPSRALHLLEAMANRNFPRWHLLRGTVCLKQEQWSEAADHLQQAEADFPKEANPLLETCWRELGNFRKAYEYACKQR